MVGRRRPVVLWLDGDDTTTDNSIIVTRDWPRLLYRKIAIKLAGVGTAFDPITIVLTVIRIYIYIYVHKKSIIYTYMCYIYVYTKRKIFHFHTHQACGTIASRWDTRNRKKNDIVPSVVKYECAHSVCVFILSNNYIIVKVTRDIYICIYIYKYRKRRYYYAFSYVNIYRWYSNVNPTSQDAVRNVDQFA